jgi:hypothetical protein
MRVTPEMLEFVLIERGELAAEDIEETSVHGSAAGGARMRPWALDVCPPVLGDAVLVQVVVHVELVGLGIEHLSTKHDELVHFLQQRTRSVTGGSFALTPS